MTPDIPLNLKLRNKKDREVAFAQDIIVTELYKFFPEAIIHGGTGIWRCYQGNRFSEDVDVYIKRDDKKIEEFFKSLENKGFKIIKKRLKENSLYSGLEFNGIETKFEATFQNKKPFFKKYETANSFFINVYTLTPEDLIIEKVETYLSRKKIRDLYDIAFLINYIENKELVKSYLKNLIEKFEKPIDEKNLASIIILGVIPNYSQLLTEIKRWAR
ncbi:nucleotidyl transferase AbiEii/AbiGii toxin family protein [Candidatus Pacearchaeota archaeon]|nr:nucleotidyl transferase AbiEii/AbiGii toxin family protein [Candidatus Pacearchaeota archaeon]